MINSFKLLLFNKSFCVELCIFRNMAYTFANHPLYKMTQCLQKMELFFLFSVKITPKKAKNSRMMLLF